LKKLLDHVSERKGVYSINISLATLDNRNMYSLIKKYANEIPSLPERVIFEIPLGHLDSMDKEHIEESVKDMQATGYRIINDNLSNGDRILNVLTYNVDFVKLSPEVYSNQEERLKSEITLSALKSISREKSVKVIGTMVSNQEEYDALQEIEYVSHMQGFFVSDRKQEF